MTKFKTKLCRYPTRLKEPQGLSACMGNFDGVHLGHLSLLKKTVEISRQRSIPSALISFYPHPAVVLRKANTIPRLTGCRETLEILSQLGVDYLYLIRFTPEFSKLTAEEFAGQILIENLNVQNLVVGPDARVGRGARGDVNFLKDYFSRASRALTVQENLEIGNVRVSSRLMREAVSAGKIEEAAKMLGRNFSFYGRVVKGNQLGRSLEFPTANLWLKPGRLWPPNGVYASRVLLGGKLYKSVTNIGVRPTVNAEGSRRTIESYLFGYDGPDFYGTRLKLEFVKKLRQEKRFDSLEELKQQIKNDLEAALEVL